MPLIQVELMEESHAEPENGGRQQVMAAMVSIEGENIRPATWFSIEEVCSGEWSIGGRAVTTRAVRT